MGAGRAETATGEVSHGCSIPGPRNRRREWAREEGGSPGTQNGREKGMGGGRITADGGREGRKRQPERFLTVAAFPAPEIDGGNGLGRRAGALAPRMTGRRKNAGGDRSGRRD